ncbi:hypothetical protein EV426DRAFT_639444 [Tirmania nivea]|nr:hypothetical protein EV426DRAFT_639444 [Tirmania nivea]
MRASSVFAAALSLAAVSAYGYGNETEWTTTEVVTQYTTYCPFPTTIVENNYTYTVTEPTTLTITNCPCTRTLTYTTVTETHCPGGCHKPTDTPTYPNVTVTTHAPPAPPTEYPTEYPTVVPNVTAPPGPPPSEGGAVANQATIVGGALAALVGVAAYLL